MKIGIIGTGNMASAVIKGMYNSKEDAQFVTYNLEFEGAKKLADAVDGVAVKTLKELNDVDTILIGCKPQHFEGLAKEMTSELDLGDKHLLSIMAAISVDTIRSQTDCNKVTRLMPSLPIEFNEGISLLFHSDQVESSTKDSIKKLLSNASNVYDIDTEEMFNKITVISGSGPAYVYYFTYLMEEVLTKWGLPKEQSKEMAIKLFKGSSITMENDSKHTLGELVDKVTSKKGVTIEAVNVFKEMGMPKIVEAAVNKAYERSCEIEKSI